MYYVMSIPEVLVLLFVLVLWMISIFFCYKRYEKINTIERADMPNMSLKNANHSMETQSCHSLSKNNVTNNCQNVTPATYTCSLKENNSFIEPSDAFGTNNSIYCNNYLLEKQIESAYPNLYYIDETNAKTSRFELISYQKYQKYRKYHQNFNIYTSQNQTPRLISRPYLAQLKALMSQSLSRKNLESQAYLNNSKLDMSKQEIPKSNSEPALKEFLIEPKKTKLVADLVDGYLIKSNSICNDDSAEQDEIKLRLADKRSRLLYNNKSLNDNNLIDPHKIPKVIQKSLIDLHKKSMWNLAHRPQSNDKSSTQSKSPLNFLHFNHNSKLKSRELDSSQNNLSRVITQMKNGNEIKMKINDNLL